MRRRRCAELRERHGCAGTEGVPERLRSRAEGRERRAIVARVERGVRVDHLQHRAHGLADASTLGRDVVLDAAADPQARHVLIEDEAKPRSSAHAQSVAKLMTSVKYWSE